MLADDMLDPAGVLLCNVRLNLQRFHQELLNQHMAFIYFLRFFVAFVRKLDIAALINRNISDVYKRQLLRTGAS